MIIIIIIIIIIMIASANVTQHCGHRPWQSVGEEQVRKNKRVSGFSQKLNKMDYLISLNYFTDDVEGGQRLS